MLRGAALSLVVMALSGAAHAQSLAVDPNHPVSGSCAEVLQPLFATLRAAPVAGPVGRMDVEVVTTVRHGRVQAEPHAIGVRNFDADAQTLVLAAFKRAYEGPEREGCVGVVTRRARWIVRKGAADAMWRPDDPTIINRPVAATTLPDGATRIELIDPALGFSRIYGPSGPRRGPKCFESSALRDTGVMPPTAMMAPGARYQVRFRLEADGRVDVVRLPDTVTAGSTLARALESYVRDARYYPKIDENCVPQVSWLTIVAERPA
jgi:hypothetical protein